VVVGPGAQFCTLLEEWVLGVGMSTLGRNRLCTPRIGEPQVPMTLEHPRCGFASSDLIPRQRALDRFVPACPSGPHWFFQVVIKTFIHSFITPTLIYTSYLWLSLYRFIINMRSLWYLKQKSAPSPRPQLGVNLNIDGAPITSRTHTHPSHSQTSRLLTSSLSLGVPVPRVTKCMWDV
jgi:hypothetical protein